MWTFRRVALALTMLLALATIGPVFILTSGHAWAWIVRLAYGVVLGIGWLLIDRIERDRN